MFLVSSCSCLTCLWPTHWSQVLSREWRCNVSWSKVDRHIWVINNLIAYVGAAYIRGLTVTNLLVIYVPIPMNLVAPLGTNTCRDRIMIIVQIPSSLPVTLLLLPFIYIYIYRVSSIIRSTIVSNDNAIINKNIGFHCITSPNQNEWLGPDTNRKGFLIHITVTS